MIRLQVHLIFQKSEVELFTQTFKKKQKAEKKTFMIVIKTITCNKC